MQSNVKRSLLDLLIWNSAFPGASRTVFKGFTGGLNFLIVALLQRHLSNERQGRPEEMDHRAGSQETDTVMAAGDAAEGEEVRDVAHTEQGYDAMEEPLVVAGRIKSVYDYVAAILLENARMRVLPDDRRVPDPFHLATTVENSLNFRASAPVRIDEAAAKAKAEMYGLSVDDVKAPIIARNKRMQLATLRDAERLVEMYHALNSIGEDGHALECEASFDRLHPLQQTKVLISLDRACMNAYKGFVAEDVQGTRQDAGSDAVHVNGFRWEVRKVWRDYLGDPRFARLYGEVQTQPAWPAEPMKSIEPVRKAA
jgi:hypothetical protein